MPPFAGQLSAIQAPHCLVTGPCYRIGVLFETLQQIVQKGALAAAVGAVKNINFVLLGATSQRLNMIDQPVGKKTVRKKRVICAFDEQPAAVIAHILDRFGVVGIFIDALAHICFEQIVKDLEHVPDGADGVG